jgi:hypothetical protein
MSSDHHAAFLYNETMFDLLTEVQDGCKVPRLTIVDDHVAGTIDLVSFVAIATDACDAKLFQSAQTKDGIQFETT